MLVIPALLLVGVPPVQAIATNKLQGSFGTLTAAVTMISKRQVELEAIRKPFLTALAGSVFGAIAIQYTPAGTMDFATPAVLLLIALYFLFFDHSVPHSGWTSRPPAIRHSTFGNFVTPGIGFYDGAFGPGAGSFYALSGVALRGKDLVQATADAKVLNFASNLAALAIFIVSGKIVWLVGGVMIAGTAAGAYLGSLVVLNTGARVIRPAIIIMSLAMLCVYIWRSLPGS